MVQLDRVPAHKPIFGVRVAGRAIEIAAARRRLRIMVGGVAQVFVSVTRLRVRAWKYLPAFLVQALRSARQAKRAAGSLSVSLLRDANLAFWTCTVWTDETAMRSFMTSGVHGRGMRRLLDWCDEASVAHWREETTEPPSWQQAYQAMRERGRRSRVNHPSEAQRRFEYPSPRTP